MRRTIGTAVETERGIVSFNSWRIEISNGCVFILFFVPISPLSLPWLDG